ncbi:heparinase II/III domain-containing protein [Pseudoduganella lutea]|nr:heparinase II/III family protein [Pseudoduganella lutea]
MRTRPILRTITLTLASAFTINSYAALPFEPKTTHPYLYASADDVATLRAKVGPLTMPPVGKIEIKVKPAVQSVLDLNGLPMKIDPDSSILMGSFPDDINHFFIRNVTPQGATQAKFHVRFREMSEPEARPYPDLVLPLDRPSTITVTWDTAAKTIIVAAEGNNPITLNNANWQPRADHLHFVGNKNQHVVSLKMSDKAGNVLWDGTELDWDLAAAYYGFTRFSAPQTVATVTACKVPMPTNKSDPCNVAEAGRGWILSPAKRLALAYNLTKEDRYWEAAKYYANHIMLNTNLGAGGEWSMSARVAALGVLYDAFYDKFSADDKKKIQDTIIQTIKTDIAAADLISMICGSGSLSGTTLACAGTPDISRFYISGHHASAMTGAAIGLLAIANERSEVDPMLDTIYDHLVNGLLPAREYISGDGGHQTMFAYNSTVGEVAERLVLWRRALNTNGAPILQTSFMSKVINPYIDGLRAGGGFPATGDNFGLSVAEEGVGYMASVAASEGNGHATTFYEDQVKRYRSRISPNALWEALYFPEPKEPRADVNDRKLSARYQIAGNVFMRDTWDYENATLLDFKSSTFSSENHQHLDQNSFSLFYRKPLLLDSGAYDEYNTPHWYNYYRRTIAHNSIVLYKPTETYKHNNSATEYSNDGGQWYKGEMYPTLDEIKPGAKNALQGIARYEDHDSYAYVSANAAQAYQAGKLDPIDGFRRRIVYLRWPGKKPVVVVHDRVHALTPQPAVSLLHTVAKPETAAAVSVGYDNADGRYTLQGNTNLPIVVRNHPSNLTIEPLLPRRPHIKFVGGAPNGATTCEDQVVDKAEIPDLTDCRFTVRSMVNGTLQWTNFAPRKSWTTGKSDFGAWRIEISQVPEGQTSDHYQFFMNVLRVGDEGGPVAATSTLLTSPDLSANAVTIDAATSVVFATDFSTTNKLRWKPVNTLENVVVTGLVPSAIYQRVYDSTAKEWILTKVATAGSNTLTSSSEGVIYTSFAIP